MACSVPDIVASFWHSEEGCYGSTQPNILHSFRQARFKVRVVCSRAYHALFMQNMLICPTPEELEDFGEPDFVILNAGPNKANKHIPYVTSDASVAINLQEKQMVILGTEYAGEMKKGVFTIMHYWMPKRGILSLHSGCNMGKEDDVSLFFGLSGECGLPRSGVL